ncbi:MAG: hypothetical protein MHPSP_001744, partial [Paramarteilia canceri]
NNLPSLAKISLISVQNLLNTRLMFDDLINDEAKLGLIYRTLELQESSLTDVTALTLAALATFSHSSILNAISLLYKSEMKIRFKLIVDSFENVEDCAY